MKRLLFAIYGFSFFNKFLLLAPVYAIFIQQNGLSDLQLSTMFIVMSGATILGQVPSDKSFGTAQCNDIGSVVKNVCCITVAVRASLCRLCHRNGALGITVGISQCLFRRLIV